jgi:hypothetical protein
MSNLLISPTTPSSVSSSPQLPPLIKHPKAQLQSLAQPCSTQDLETTPHIRLIVSHDLRKPPPQTHGVDKCRSTSPPISRHPFTQNHTAQLPSLLATQSSPMQSSAMIEITSTFNLLTISATASLGRGEKEWGVGRFANYYNSLRFNRRVA